MRSSLAKPAAVLLFLASLAVSLPLVAGLLGRLHPAFDSFAHFRWHLSLAMLVLSVLLLGTRFRLQGLLGGVLGAAAIYTTLPGMGFLHGTASAEIATPAPVYRLLHLNLRFDNPDAGAVLSLIGEAKPDVISLNEVSLEWQPHLEKLAAMYPYRTVCPSPRRVGGVAILSRRPPAPGQAVRCSDDGGLAIARIDFGGRWVDVAALHLHWPWPFRQPRQIEDLSALLGSIGNDAVLTGDLNAATWSAAVGTVAAASGTSAYQGLGPTWLLPLVPVVLVDVIGLPIDHLFTKGEVIVVSATRLRPVGSDHLPVLVQFSLPTGTPEDDASVAATNARVFPNTM